MMTRRPATGNLKGHLLPCRPLLLRLQQCLLADKGFVEIDEPFQPRLKRRSCFVNIAAVQ